MNLGNYAAMLLSKPCKIFDSNKFKGMKVILQNDGIAIFNTDLGDKFINNLNNADTC